MTAWMSRYVSGFALTYTAIIWANGVLISARESQQEAILLAVGKEEAGQVPQTRSWQSRMCLKRRKKKIGKATGLFCGFSLSFPPCLPMGMGDHGAGALHLQRCSIAPGLSETFGLVAVCGCAEDSSQILVVLQTQLCEEGGVGPAGGEQGCACFCLPCEWERRPYTCRSGSLIISPTCQSATQWGSGSAPFSHLSASVFCPAGFLLPGLTGLAGQQVPACWESSRLPLTPQLCSLRALGRGGSALGGGVMH